MGRHETFENGTPVAEELLAGTMLDRPGEPDPIFAAIAAAREAERWANGDIPGEGALVNTPEDKAEDAERRSRTNLADKAHRVVFGIRPATSAGFMALLDFATEQREIWQGWSDGPDVLGAIRDSAALLVGIVREPVEPDPVFAVLERFQAMRAEHEASPNKDAKFGTPESEAFEEATDALGDAENEVWSDLVNTQPTSLPGLHAMIRFMGAEYERFTSVHETADVFGTIGEAVAALMGPDSPQVVVSSDGVDPIFAAIEETKRLDAARDAALLLPQLPGNVDPPEQMKTLDAFFAHINDVLLVTPPRTAAGCAALCRYALAYQDANGIALDETPDNCEHYRILDLIARSPLL